MEWFQSFLLLTSQSVSLFVTHKKNKSKHATLEFCLGLKLGLSTETFMKAATWKTYA